MYCYNCESKDLEKKEIKKGYTLRGIRIEIRVKAIVCNKCKEVTVLDIEKQIIQKLYDEYNNKNNLLTGEDLKFIRTKKELSQQEFDKMLGFTKGTTRAIENGFALTIEGNQRVKDWLETT